MKNVGLLIGNGFTRDFTDQYDFDSSKPLHCFGNSKITYDSFIDYIPSIRDELLISPPENDDFTAIKSFIRANKGDQKKLCDLQRFLAMSFTLFQLEINKHEADMTNWKWVKWLKQNKENISFAVSLNYDVVLESALKSVGQDYYRVGSTEPAQGIPIIKPHGSIDFDTPDNIIKITPISSLWSSCINLLDAGTVRVVPHPEWLNPRIVADIIPPLQENHLKKHGIRWIESGADLYDDRVSHPDPIDSLVIIGHSYSNADRPEVKHYLNRLPKDATVFVIGDGKPNTPLVQHLKTRQLKHVVLTHDKVPW